MISTAFRIVLVSVTFLCSVIFFAGLAQAFQGGDESGGRSVKFVELDSLTRMNNQALKKLISDDNDEVVRTGGFSAWGTKSLITALINRRAATLNLLERMSRLKDKEKRVNLLTGLIKSLNRQVSNAEATYKAAGERLIKHKPKEYSGRYGLRSLLWFPERAKDEFEKNYVRLFLIYRNLLWFRNFLEQWKKEPNAGP